MFGLIHFYHYAGVKLTSPTSLKRSFTLFLLLFIVFTAWVGIDRYKREMSLFATERVMDSQAYTIYAQSLTIKRLQRKFCDCSGLCNERNLNAKMAQKMVSYHH